MPNSLACCSVPLCLPASPEYLLARGKIKLNANEEEEEETKMKMEQREMVEMIAVKENNDIKIVIRKIRRTRTYRATEQCTSSAGWIGMYTPIKKLKVIIFFGRAFRLPPS